MCSSDLAYRRPPTPDEVEYVLRFHNKIRPDYPNFIEAIRQSLAMTLISPQFLYLVEPKRAGKAARRLTDHEVAARLSYFLWSTMPDEKLSQLADRSE